MEVLGRYISNLGMPHYKAAKRVLRYLYRTKNYMLTYIKSEELEIIRYSNSDFTRCIDSKKETSGYIDLLARVAILCKSAKQALITSSTMAT